MADLIVSFRAVGLYCFFNQVNINQIQLAEDAPHGLDPASLTAESTVEEIMLALMYDKNNVTSDGNRNFSFTKSGAVISSMQYTYEPGDSTRPFQTSAHPPKGMREIQSDLGVDPSRVWQYYRTVSGRVGESEGFTEIKLIAANFQQPPFSETPLNTYLDGSIAQIPSGFALNNYNLTWRCVTIDFSPEAKEKYLARMQ